MADEIKSFSCFADTYNTIMRLQGNEGTILIQALYRYVFAGEWTEIEDRFLSSTFERMARQADLSLNVKKMNDEFNRIVGHKALFVNDDSAYAVKMTKAIDSLSKEIKKFKGTVEEFRDQYYDHPAYAFIRERNKDPEGYHRVPQGTHNKTEQNETESKPIETNLNELNISESNTGESNRPEMNVFEKSTDKAAGEDEILYLNESELRLEIGKIFKKNRRERYAEDEGGKLQGTIYQALKGKPLTHAQLESEVVKMIDQNDLPF